MSLCTIIGMGPGLGLSIAKRFAQEGFDIGMISRNERNLESYEKYLTKYGVKINHSKGNAGNYFNLTLALGKFNETEVLVYNAAVVEKSYLGTSPEKISSDLNVNVGGAFAAAQYILPRIEKIGKGTLLFTGGGFAHEPNSNYISLSMGKAALLNLGLNLANQYEPKGIHVAVVSIYGKIEPGTKYDPDLIAEEYWKLHSQPREEWQKEIHFK